MTQPVIPTVTVVTIGVQGPPGLGISFAGLTILTSAQSGATLTPNVMSPIDARGGTSVWMFPVATDGMLVGVGDAYGASQLNPIQLVAQGVGVTIADPSIAGVYGTTVHVAVSSFATFWWSYILTANKWVPAFF